jgi:eukaryotic-like serine/threonine-protein kinase
MNWFGGYEVLGEVGAGSTGRVYRTRHRELGREAAVKVLDDRVLATPGALDRLRSEAKVLSELDHPNVVSLYDYVEEAGGAWLAEEWVEGAPLDRILQQYGRLTPEQALGVVRGAVSGLAYAHDRGIVHRDVSVGNVLADMAGTSMLVDFGLAALAGAGTVLGTPASLSPEAARGEPVGKPGDVYSAAAVLYQLLVGRPVFDGNAVQVVSAHRDRPAPALTGHGEALQALMGRALAKDPALRPPDAAAFLADLDDAAERQYGADWKQRASIATLVAGAAAAGAAGLAGAGAGGAAAPTVVFDGAGTPVAGSPITPAPLPVGASGRTGRSALFKVTVGLSAAAVVAAAAVAAVLVSDGDSDSTDGTSSSVDQVVDGEDERQEPVAEPEPTVEETQPSGRFRGTVRFQRIVPPNGAVDASVREPENRVWTLAPQTCTERVCRGSISSSSGAAYDYTWNGSQLRIPGETYPVTSQCQTEDGLPAPGTLRARLRTTFEVTGLGGNGGVNRLQVSFTTTVLSYQDDTANNCTWNRPVPKYWVKGGTFRAVR